VFVYILSIHAATSTDPPKGKRNYRLRLLPQFYKWSVGFTRVF